MARKTSPSGGSKDKPPAKARAKSARAAKASAPKTGRAKTADAAAPKPARSPRRSTPGSGPALVIVESPKKARSIGKFLGSAFDVRASLGHVRDLPERGSDLGIDVRDGYRARYEVPTSKQSTINDLKKSASKASIVYLATDPDREGEAIAWHLKEALGLDDDRVRRVLFYEITEKAVREAFDHSGEIDLNKVNAQQARRFLDRFVGYMVSPLLWRKITGGLSAGRVQSVAVRLIAEREAEIRAFKEEEYWKITAQLTPVGSSQEADRFTAELAEWQGKKFEAADEATARAIHDALRPVDYRVATLETTEKRDKPEAPFKTSTLQQQAAIRLRFPGKRTMRLAQELYEGIDVDGSGPVGLISYMRTDSLRVSDDALKSVRAKIQADYGEKYLPPRPNMYAAGKMAQEAHEAIRPTELSFSPERVKDRLSSDQFKLYQLIYRRFVASQMTPAVFEVTNVVVAAGEGRFKTQGKILRFDGYRRVLGPAGKQEDQLLPAINDGSPLTLLDLVPSQHFTQPPPRFSEATLIKALEKENIGRPSTYAPIIQTIQDRGYVDQQERRFHATDLGMIVTDQLVKHFPKIMDVKFTAHMEDELDDIVTAKEQMNQVLDEFYFPFEEAVETAKALTWQVDAPEHIKCPKCAAAMIIKFSKSTKAGKGRPFYSCSRYPECDGSSPLSGGSRPASEDTAHTCPACGKILRRRESKRGPFLYCSGYPECKQIFDQDAQGNPVPRKPVEVTDYKCRKCGSPMALREGPRGPFLGCTGYPKCRTTMPVDEHGKPIEPPQIDVKCPKCGGEMSVKQGRRGAFLGCMKYPKCRGTAQVPDDLKDKLPAAPAAARSPGQDLKSIPVEETCEQCGSPMVVRQGRRGPFLGCSAYPKCRSAREPNDQTKASIESFLAAQQAPTTS